jgi:hypothetical protein
VCEECENVCNKEQKCLDEKVHLCGDGECERMSIIFWWIMMFNLNCDIKPAWLHNNDLRKLLMITQRNNNNNSEWEYNLHKFHYSTLKCMRMTQQLNWPKNEPKRNQIKEILAKFSAHNFECDLIRRDTFDDNRLHFNVWIPLCDCNELSLLFTLFRMTWILFYFIYSYAQ